jgi:hypothetical protein
MKREAFGAFLLLQSVAVNNDTKTPLMLALTTPSHPHRQHQQLGRHFLLLLILVIACGACLWLWFSEET